MRNDFFRITLESKYNICFLFLKNRYNTCKNKITFKLYMEYKIHKKIRNYFNVHIYIRFFLWLILGIIAIIPILLPIFPWSLFIGVFILIVWVLLVVPWKKVRHVIKLRKWLIYMFKNIHKKRIIKHKIYDISSHIKEILNEKKWEKITKIIWKHKKEDIKKED